MWIPLVAAGRLNVEGNRLPCAGLSSCVRHPALTKMNPPNLVSANGDSSMTITEVFGSGFLLAAISAIGFAFAESKSTTEVAEENEPADVDNQASQDAINGLAALRLINQVKLLEEQDEGLSILEASPGVYGYTCSPLQASPVFSKRIFESFEVHKCPDSIVHLIGFVTPDDAKRLRDSDRVVDVIMFPEAWDESTEAVSIAQSRLVRSKGPSREHGNYVNLTVEPSSDY
jgi:hypothetical protein